jgi:hypothetical protein
VQYRSRLRSSSSLSVGSDGLELIHGEYPTLSTIDEGYDRVVPELFHFNASLGADVLESAVDCERHRGIISLPTALSSTESSL